MPLPNRFKTTRFSLCATLVVVLAVVALICSSLLATPATATIGSDRFSDSLALVALFQQLFGGRSSSKAEGTEKSTLSERITVQAAGRGNPLITLANGHDLSSAYSGPGELTAALEQNLARPLALASADFDEDGVPDLLGGYALWAGGMITLHRGNVDSIHPNSPEAKQRKATSTFTDSPFLSPASVFEVPEAPDFLSAGDFDADGHWDVVAAARGGNALYLLAGNGRGGFSSPRQIELAGHVTAMVSGEINRLDGLTDVVVGIAGPDGPTALVFEGPDGALKAAPEAFSLPAEPTALALGQLDASAEMDLAIAADNQLLIVHGRDRKLSLDEIQRAEVKPAIIERRSFPFTIAALALGDFIWGQEPLTDIALLSGDGGMHFLRPREEARGRRAEAAVKLKSAVKWEESTVVRMPAPTSPYLLYAVGLPEAVQHADG